LGNTVIKINHGCGFLLVDTVDESKNDFEDWGLWWLLLGYSHAADLLNPISDLRLFMFNIFYIIIQGIALWHLCFFF
jgi:hypothetical protein